MKKLLMILVMGLLWCNVGFAHNFITFKNCYSSESGSMEEEGRDEFTFDIDKKRNTVVRTIIWDDETVEKFKDLNMRKINQDEYKIKAIGKRYISTDFPNKVLGTEFVFDLKKYTIQLSIRTKSDIDTFTLICEK